MESDSHDGTTELTRAERTARKDVTESVENAVPDETEADESPTLSPSMIPVVAAPLLKDSASNPSPKSPDDVLGDLDDASAQSLVEARRDLT